MLQVLPVPSFNIIDGGVHAGNSLAMQEFMIFPIGASSFHKAMQMGSEVGSMYLNGRSAGANANLSLPIS